MPPPRKVDQLPEEHRLWLNEALKTSGFGNYVEITEALNERLDEAGCNLQIGKSAVHAYGKGYSEFVELQREASTWAKNVASEAGVTEEAELHGLLVQQLMSQAFSLLKSGDAFSAKDLESFGKMLSSVMSSSTSRERILDKERVRIREEEQRAMASKLDEAVAAGDVDVEAAERARLIMGFK